MERERQRPTGLKRIWALWRGGQTDVPGLEARIKFLGGTRDVAFTFVAVVIPGAVGIKWFFDGGMGPTFVAFMGYLELVAVLVLVLSRLRLRDLQAELRTVEFENEILEQSEKSPILLFLKHQAELKRYYDQALQQSGLAFVLGVICVASGLAVVGVGFVLLQNEDTTQGIATAALAAVGALLSGFVARVYLGIHRGAVESLTGFHEKFVETHHLHLAGVFASRVGNGASQDATLVALVQAAASQAPGDASSPS